MANIHVYIIAEKNVEVLKDEVFLKDIAKIYCSDENVAAKIKAIKIFTFSKEIKRKLKKTEINRQVINVLKLIELIEASHPGITVNSLGEMDVLVEKIHKRKHKQPMEFFKICLASGVCFFGTAFTIMAFHNDISINKVFSKVYELVMGQPATGYTVMEISYSIGLALGILIFFNHIGGRRITKDPTPIEVAMRTYEDDVNKALVATADREGKTLQNK
ncbi:MAG: stage V sporulation protein AA [Lachnospiraceae bacterium]|nr:stage V sporulation protein AA [Lachnospiraceae bacterium]